MTQGGIYPVLRYADPKAAIDWLVKAFGFTQKAVHSDDNGHVAHAELSFGDGVMMLGPGETDSSARGEGNGAVYVAVDDADAHHDRAARAGAEIIYPLTDQDYGSRDYAARDLEGNAWFFGTYRP